jgi:hypothetical protein
MNKEKRPRTQKVCLQVIIDEIDLAYNKMKNEVKVLQIERNIKFSEAFKVWKQYNKNVDTTIFK